MSDYKIHDGSLYDYNCGIYCGVLVKEHVMKKLAALQAKHLEDVKQVLMNELDKGNVFSSHWTLHYSNDKQTTVTFINENESVAKRIKNATTASPPIHRPLVFIANDMTEAETMADARFKVITGE